MIYLCFIYLLILPSSIKGNCEDPSSPFNGRTSIMGNVAIHSCKEGFVLDVGNASEGRQCVDGRWTSEIPQCAGEIGISMSRPDQEGNILVTFNKAVLFGLHLVVEGTLDETENLWNIEALPCDEEQWEKIEFERIDDNYPNIVFRNVSNFVNKLRLSSSQRSLEIPSLNVFALPGGEMRWTTTTAICWCDDGFELDSDSTATTECTRERWPGTQAFCQPIGNKVNSTIHLAIGIGVGLILLMITCVIIWKLKRWKYSVEANENAVEEDNGAQSFADIELITQHENEDSKDPVEDDFERQRKIIIRKIKLQRQNGESFYDQVRGPPRPVNGKTETVYAKVDLETNCSNTMNLNDQMK